MSDAAAKKGRAAHWLRRATFRLAECEAELRRIPEGKAAGRKRKLTDRCERYRALLAHLRQVADALSGDGDPKKEMAALEREATSIRERMSGAAATLVRSRERLKQIRARWGALADRVMKAREDQGEEPGPVPRLELGIPAPPQEAPPEEREAHWLLRELGL